MLERSHIEGLEILTPSISEHGYGSLMVETRWPIHGQQLQALVLPYERTVAARSGFLCEPSFHAKQIGTRTMRCVQGEIFLVVVDTRNDSRTFGQSQTFELSGNSLQFIKLPISLACGYLVTSDSALLDERLSHDPHDAWQWLDWRDPRLQILWPEAAFTFAHHTAPSLMLHEIPPAALPTCAAETQSLHAVGDSKLDARPPRRDVAEYNSGTSTGRKPGCDSLTLTATVERRPMNNRFANDRQRQRPAAPPSTLHGLRAARSEERDERILVLGCQGQLGRDLCRELSALGTVVGACRRPALSRSELTVEVDLTRPASLRQAIRNVEPTLIVNACAMTDLEACEAHPRSAQLINATAPMLVADEARALEIPIIHFCTASVYGGSGQAAWREGDVIDPNCHYARTKAIGTEAVRNSNAPHLILRTDWLYSLHSPNFVQTMVDQALTRDSLAAAADQYGTPTASSWLAAVTARLLSLAEGSLADWLDVNGGLLHATPEGFTSRLDVAEHVLAVCRFGGLPVTARSVRSLVSLPAGRAQHAAYNSKLDCARLGTLLGGAIPRWQKQLTEHLHAYISQCTTYPRSVAA